MKHPLHIKSQSQSTRNSERTSRRHLVCGWQVESDLCLTSVPASTLSGVGADISIKIATGRSPVPTHQGRVFLEHTPAFSLIGIENVADFKVMGGREIWVWPAAQAIEKDIEIFLFGPVWATLCHQRGILPLHASAILAAGGITAFAGHRGVGKSTTAAMFVSWGFELVSDDILPISYDHDLVPGAWPYLRRLKLKKDSLSRLALVPAEPVSQLDRKKYFVTPKNAAPDEWTKLERIFLLEFDASASSVLIDRIAGSEAIRALIDQTYHFQFVLGSNRFRDHLTICARITR